MLTTLSQMADHQVYLNNNRKQNANQYDGAVVAPFIETLSQSSPKKFIVVHLLGTHRKYDYRYPKMFKKFVDNDNVPLWVKTKNLEEYNSYDNSILYNDTVIAALINNLREHNDNALLVYFSDHGEEVFDYEEKLFCGRNEEAPSPAMYTVPFITWASTDWRKSRQMAQWTQYKNRPFSSADFIYTLPQMIGINFSGMDPTRSLVSDTFTKHTRWIGNPNQPQKLQDFDKIQRPKTSSPAIATTPTKVNSAQQKRKVSLAPPI
jgi:heptose-I-phosphate ethanolaminephosphotransferase